MNSSQEAWNFKSNEDCIKLLRRLMRYNNFPSVNEVEIVRSVLEEDPFGQEQIQYWVDTCMQGALSQIKEKSLNGIKNYLTFAQIAFENSEPVIKYLGFCSFKWGITELLEEPHNPFRTEIIKIQQDLKNNEQFLF